MASLASIAEKLAAQEIPEKPQSVLIYGPPKTGKSTLAAQLAKKYNLIWIDVDMGGQVLFTAIPKEYWSRVELIQVVDTNESPRAIRMLNKFFKAGMIATGVPTIPLAFCEIHGDIQCAACAKLPPAFKVNPATLTTDTVVVIDTLGRVGDSAIAHALGVSGDMVFKKKEFSHYDNQGLLLKALLTMQQYQKFHRVFISHEEELTQEDGQNKLTPRAGTRNFSRHVAGYFDHVVYCSVRNKKHCISSLTTSDIKVQAGNRNNVDIKSIDDFLDIFSVKHILEGKTSNFDFSHEATEIKEEETQKAAASEN